MPRRPPEAIKSETFAVRVHPKTLERWEEAAQRFGATQPEFVTWVVDRNADLVLGPRWKPPKA